MICPKCNKTYDDKINICPECGTELIEESEFTSELEDKIEDNIKKIDENNKITNEKSTRSKVEIYKEQRKIMKEDEENYKKFIENEDSEAFGKLVERLVEHYKDKELEENYAWFRKYEENQRKIEENNKLINEKHKQLRANEEYIKSAEARIKDYKEERKRVEQRINELKRLNEVKKMRIVAWNCLGKFDTKIDEIKKLKADIYVICECEDPSNYDYQKYKDFASKHYWVGDNNYGLGIFAKDDVELELVNLDNKGLRYFLPVRVNDDFNLLGVWTKIDKGESNAKYPKLITQYYEEHKDSGFFNEDMIMCGDFNCDKRLKNPTHGENVDEMMDKLSEIQLVDVYHDIYEEKQGEESKATFYLYKHLDKPYHLDHVFAAKGKVNCLQVEKDVDKWVNPKKSDHVPIIFEI